MTARFPARMAQRAMRLLTVVALLAVVGTSLPASVGAGASSELSPRMSLDGHDQVARGAGATSARREHARAEDALAGRTSRPTTRREQSFERRSRHPPQVPCAPLIQYTDGPAALSGAGARHHSLPNANRLDGVLGPGSQSGKRTGACLGSFLQAAQRHSWSRSGKRADAAERPQLRVHGRGSAARRPDGCCEHQRDSDQDL